MFQILRCLVVAAPLAAVGTMAVAQTSSYRSASAETGKATRLWTVSALKKDCSVGDLGGVRVVAPPKNGTLALKKGKAKTPASFRCPNVETPVELVLYASKPGFSGTDEVVFETKNADGVVDKHTFKIEVGARKAGQPAPKGDAVDL